MQAGWFGDRYDHLKWSVILRLAETEQTILYVVMLRETDGSPRVSKSVEPFVAAFFRSLESYCPKPPLERIVELDSRIKLVAASLPDNAGARHLYFQQIRDIIGQTERGSLCVFLDPDTGMGRNSSGKHVSDRELKMLWDSMRAGDRLVVYQHGWRPKGGDWHSIAHTNFADALDIPEDSVTQEPKEKTNLALFTAVKL